MDKFVTILGLCVHFLLFASIFDIYFRTPILQGLTPYESSSLTPPPAKRLVLFVADGLRADRLFELDEKGLTRAPYVRNIIMSKGCWGVSNTRVPTESRPGHVAIIAGFYEDVSAVTKGWKENPVNFDSVFNQSRYTWSWGSPDILNIFSKDTTVKHIYTTTYSASDEDFAREDPSQLDSWVLDKFEGFLEEAAKNTTLSSMIKKDKIIFFMHLLGLDTVGHAYKPHSKEYINNINLVDNIVEKTVNLINEYFGDDQTSFILTSDHGMTDWGSHGAGDVEETRTPLVAWGAGVRGPLGAGKDNHKDSLSEDWKLSTVRRTDVSQADIAPLISTLIGIPIPVNSMGVLPVEILNTEWEHRAESLLLNCHQILEQYHAKKRDKEETTISWFYYPFKELTREKELELFEMISTVMKQRRFKDAVQIIQSLIGLALKGFVYYQKYDRFTLSFSVLLSFFGWVAYVILVLVKDYTNLMHSTLETTGSVAEKRKTWFHFKISLIFVTILFLACFLLQIQSSPSMYYAYYLLPIFLWWLVMLKWDVIQQIYFYLTRMEKWLKTIGVGILLLCGTELLVVSFFHREVFTMGLIAIAFWPLFTQLKESRKILVLSWFATCLVMAIFPMLPVVGRNSNYNIVTLSGWLSILLTAFCARRKEIGLVRSRRDSQRREPFHVVILTIVQVFVIWLSTMTVKSTSSSISSKLGLPIWCQVISWTILVISFFLPLFGSSSILTRLLNIAASLQAVVLLMSIVHEGFFCLVLCILMFLWLCIEHQLSNFNNELHNVTFLSEYQTPQRKTINQKIGPGDLRRAYLFLFFIFYAFYGIGNIASINSFEPTSVYCFLTIFSPFTMGFLLLIKIMIPFLLVSCGFRAILITIKVPTKALFMLVLIFSDLMALHFFFMVKDSGSWLEIGTSISHYVIMMGTILFVTFLYGLAWILTTTHLKIPLYRSKRHTM